MECEGKKLFLSKKVKRCISQTTANAGCLAGWQTEADTYCMSTASRTENFLPGLEIIGLFCLLQEGDNTEDELLKLCSRQFDDLLLTLANPVVLFCRKEIKEEGDSVFFAKSYSLYYGSLTDLNVVDIDSNPAVLVRARGLMPVVLEMASDYETLKENIELAVERLRSIFQSQVASFLLHKTNYILHSLQDQSADSNLTYKDLLKLITVDDSGEKSKAKKSLKEKCPMNFDILLQASGSAALENTFNHSVVIHSQRREFRCASFSLPLDVIVVTHESVSTYGIYKLVQSAIDEQLKKMRQCLLTYAKSLDIALPVPHHFYPDVLNFPVTVIYPLSETDDKLESHRKKLHAELFLPTNRPFFKKKQAFDFSLRSDSGYLINPHEAIRSAGVAGGKSAIVHGKYNYHHYMQDHMNDNGWGCAYRSLQTIISWFKHQGYTDMNIPTHKEIQEALVAVKDKQESFIGSKQWIGSQEVSFCLEHLIQVQSKIMFVRCGAEMANQGRELFNHFKDQGTPIMIGGGVLAHTILGVDFNQDTGDLKFLILDPHYTGGEDLNVILNKGWCGWKGVQFWDQHNFYNLCLPQRPVTI